MSHYPTEPVPGTDPAHWRLTENAHAYIWGDKLYALSRHNPDHFVMVDLSTMTDRQKVLWAPIILCAEVLGE